MNSLNLLKIKHLDKKVSVFSGFEIPEKGWINAVRKTLGLTFSQLGKRINTTPQVIKKFEQNEFEGKITLNTLKKIASSVDCRLVYAIVPNTSFENIIDTNAEKIAGKIINRVSDSMNLESQSIEKEEIQRQLDEIKFELKRNPKKIWKYEI